MLESASRTLIVLIGALALLAFLLWMRPGYLASSTALGAALIGQCVLASLCKYKQSFFWVLMIAFFWAGMQLPASGAWLQGRWIVLGVGTLTGAAIYLRERNHRFSASHLLALFCVLSAIVSASVSGYPEEALLKALSLFLLFLYAATGARLAISTGSPQVFFHRLLLASEVATYFAAFCYLVLRWPIFGNPNSLGAVMGVLVIPVMFWGFLCEQSSIRGRWLGFELCLALVLLVSSFSRAGIVAAAASCLFVTVGVRQYRMIVTGIIVSVLLAILSVTFIPLPTENLEDAHDETMTSLFLFKGKPDEGILGSRRAPWERTLAVIENHPWFGSGFGTSVNGQSAMYFDLTRTRFVDSRMTREHGNSYLAIMEWSGLLGVFPFYALVAITAWYARKVFVQLRRTGDISSVAIPAAAIIVAGLIGTAFEDWLFAVGYYLCVFYWSIAFILIDLVVSPSSLFHNMPAFVTDPRLIASAPAQ